MEITIIEGARGTGKSTVSRMIRSRVSETTLINPTGFHDDNEEGWDKITDYYDAWIGFIHMLANHDSRYLFDRFFFSEMVFSKLYKQYSFTDSYNQLCEMLADISKHESAKINIVFLTVEDPKILTNRLSRDKVQFFKVADKVDESLKQQEEYSILFSNLKEKYGSENLNLYTIPTDHKDIEEIYEEVKNIFTGNI